MRYSRVKSIVPLGKEMTYDVSMKSPHHSYVANNIVVHNCEEMGYCKFDFLGLRHLDTLMVARDLIHKRHGVWIDYYAMTDEQLADPVIWENVDKGRTLGVFQLEASYMTSVGRGFKPRDRHEGADLISVNRPGVVRAGLLDVYLDRRSGKQEVVYDHPLMEQLTGSTYGILVYQEQIQKAVQLLAGFTKDEAEAVRKIMGKMLYHEMLKLEDKFVDGCLANPAFAGNVYEGDTAKASAKRIWERLKGAGIYSFNKSHAKAYAKLFSWEVWLKYYYFAEYHVALMQTDAEKITKYVREARMQGYAILPPDINESGAKFTLTDSGIRYGLDTVRTVGPSAVKEILKHQPYTSFEDFLKRVDGRAVTKQRVENLIKIGAFDSFGKRGDLLWEYAKRGILATALKRDLKECDTEEKLAAYIKSKMPDIPDFEDERVVYEIEKELVGNYITVDPMFRYASMIDGICIAEPGLVGGFAEKEILYIGGRLSKVRPHTTKKGQPMAFAEVEWNDATFEICIFPWAWSRYKILLRENIPIVMKCEKLDGSGVHMVECERLDFLT